MADKKDTQRQAAVTESAQRQEQAAQSEQSGTEQTSADRDERNSGTADPNAMASDDAAMGEGAGLSEGEVKALRHDAGLNQSAGHTATVGAWEASPAGQAFLEAEDERVKEYEEEAEKYDEQTNDDGLTEAEAKYQEAVDKARKG